MPERMVKAVGFDALGDIRLEKVAKLKII